MVRHDINKVIGVGQKLFESQGYFNTGTEEILEKSNYPRSSFYYHFKSKEGFASRVLEQYGDSAAEYYKSLLFDDSDRSPMDRLEGLAETMANTAVEKEFKTECLVQKLSIECAGFIEVLRVSTDKQLNKMLRVLDACIKEGQQQGEIRVDMDSMEMASMVQSQLYGAFILGRLSHDGEGMKRNIKRVLDYIKI
jgi:TetR/AcrR family transcriptional repressor of nem operon